MAQSTNRSGRALVSLPALIDQLDEMWEQAGDVLDAHDDADTIETRLAANVFELILTLREMGYRR